MFSKFQCGFCKEFNAQRCLLLMIEKWREVLLLLMIEKWREVLRNGRETDEVLTDLSHDFYSINHNLLIAKFNAYGVEENSLDFIHSYLTKRKQRTKIESSTS